MKTSKLLKKAKAYIDSDEKKKQDRVANIKILLKKLKQKYRTTKAKIENENDSKKKNNLKKECKILLAQRKKGAKTLKSLKNH
jgi:hypothetical protein